MPHAGYIYSGWTAAHAARVWPKEPISKIILIGPDHRIGIKNAAICDVGAYQTPLGKINVHEDVNKLHRQPDLFRRLPVSLDKEHSLEVVLPFLQRYQAEFQLVPVVIGRGDVQRLSNALNSIIDHDTLVVVSSDLSHYLSYTEAVARDRDTISAILNMETSKLTKSDNRACGLTPLLILSEIARRHQWQPVLLHYSNSGDTAGTRSRVVGYATIAFFGDLSMTDIESPPAQFSDAHGRMLVDLARKTIADRLGASTAESTTAELSSSFTDECFKLHCGTFVTLKINGNLRGCIGNLTSTETVLDGIKRNAVNAALHDPRFSPLSKEELDRTQIEVSILSEPQQIDYQDGEDLIGKLRAHVDGVIIRKGHASATFLPQVWDQLPETEDFLNHLCMKAGLPADAWRDEELEVLTYQVQYFEEGH